MNKTMKKAVIAAAVGSAAAAAVAAGGIAKTRREMKKEFSRGEYPDRRFTTQYIYEDDYAEKHPRENIQFKSGENTLQGYIYGLENTEPKGLLVFAHGITVGHESYINMLMWFIDRGWRLFAYDGTGSCTSEGEGTVGLVQSALDLDCALNYAKTDERLSGLPVYLLGHSWGGYAVCAVQNFEHDIIAAAASISGYNDPVEMLKVGSEVKVGKTGVKLFTPFIKGYNKMTFGRNSGLNAADGLNKSGIPTIIIHGDKDTFVDFERVSIYSNQDKITNPKAEFVKLTGNYSDHVQIFKSDRSNDYTLEYMKELNELIEEYTIKGNGSGDELTDTQKKAGVTIVGAEVIPDEVRTEFLKKWDKALLNEVNSDLFEMIESFFINNSEKV